MVTTKRLNIKNRTYYFHNDLINLENFDPSLLNLHKKSFVILNILQQKVSVIMKILLV